ncbi:MAG: carboxy terminal-processing peptidase [Burkholderiaceae bacterium]|nr:carboxy terminal-processing peptidase [Burkholderiaceae bacterium]
MNKRMLWLSIAFATATITQAATPDAAKLPTPLLQPLPQEPQAAYLAAGYLTHSHYKAVPLDDAMSEKIFDRYLKSLDADKLIFTQADVDQFASARDHLDDAIFNRDLHIPFLMFNLYEERLTERFTYARSLLKQKFDFTQKESYQYQRDKASWPKSEDEMHELWRKRVKNDWLRLKLAGNDEKNIVATLDKRYENYMARVHKLKSEDAFQIFLEAYAQSTDPHTDYFGPRASEEFDISMKLSLIGIGAVLQERDEYITIREVVPGGPAALSGKLKVGDRIVGVAQGEKAPMADVLGWRLDDTVALIRGAMDSTVVLDVLPEGAGPDGKHKLISLVRKKIVLEQQVAKDSVIEVKEGNTTRRIGVISLPIFYTDFTGRQQGDKDYRSATRDVANLLAQLKKDKVDSVLIDLRNNGGGALDEAVELTGLFIDKGPVVQERFSQGQVRVENSRNTPVWDGPLGVLINRGSASASEIFAAAIQDYGRGVIIGEPSFGKGTVQSLLDLDRIAHSDQPKFGELKMTTAQFFRINGGTTQLRGVTPDISFPTSVGSADFGESSFDNALPWTQIKPADYTVEGDLSELLPMLQVRHDQRVKSDKDFQYLQEDIAEFNALRKKTSISLNEAERRAERDTQEAKIKAREKGHGGKEEKLTRDDGLQANERNLETELAEEKAEKEAKDVLLNEAAHVMSDEVDLLKSNTRLAARMHPGTTMQSITK